MTTTARAASAPAGRASASGWAISYDDDRRRRRPGHPQDASLHATGAVSKIEPAPKDSRHLGGTSPPPTELNREPTLELKARADAAEEEEEKTSSGGERGTRRRRRRFEVDAAAPDVFTVPHVVGRLADVLVDVRVVASDGDGAGPRPQQGAAGRRDQDPPALRGARRRVLTREPVDRRPPDWRSAACPARKIRGARLLAAVTSCVDADGMSMRGLATVAWAVAQLGAGSELLDAIASCVLRHLDDLGEFKAHLRLLYASSNRGAGTST